MLCLKPIKNYNKYHENLNEIENVIKKVDYWFNTENELCEYIKNIKFLGNYKEKIKKWKYIIVI